jgi:dTDP-4-dehydrorhamnose 3,5-epimerase
MKYIETPLSGLYVIELEKREDARGFFARFFDDKEFDGRGLKNIIVQANTSFSVKKGTMRGMHFQKAPHAETKFIRCIKGSIYDVAIDLRPESPTHKQWFGIELSADNRRHLFVPQGFAHGFVTLEDDSEVIYLVSEYYTPDAEGGVRFDDPAFNIKWPVRITEASDKDKSWPDYNK